VAGRCGGRRGREEAATLVEIVVRHPERGLPATEKERPVDLGRGGGQDQVRKRRAAVRRRLGRCSQARPRPGSGGSCPPGGEEGGTPARQATAQRKQGAGEEEERQKGGKFASVKRGDAVLHHGGKRRQNTYLICVVYRRLIFNAKAP
jgi:hypothetical protein